eukprot:5859387-Pyramimonas_sp.AAC.1
MCVRLVGSSRAGHISSASLAMLWRVVVSTSAQTLTRPRPRRVSATESWLRTGSTAGAPLSGAIGWRAAVAFGRAWLSQLG